MKKIRIICLAFALVLLVGAISCMFLVQSTYAKYSVSSEGTAHLTIKYDGSKNHVYGGDGKCTICGGGCNHTYTPVARVDATCTENGVLAHYACDRCEMLFTTSGDPNSVTTLEDLKITALDHDYSQIGHDETNHFIKCSRCTSVKTGTEEAHDYDVVTVDSTCMDKGTATYTCNYVGCGYSYVEEIDEKPHTYQDYVSDGNATCTQDGTETAPCIYGCGLTNTRTDEESALGHTEKLIPGYEATCIDTGLTDGYKCSVCGEITVAQEEIDLTAHDTEEIPGFAATCVDTGVTAGAICTFCGEVTVEPEEIPAIGHTQVTVPGKAATCLKSGLTEGAKCSVCNLVITAQTEIPATGHPAEQLVDLERIEPTCNTNGYTAGKMCGVCNTVTVAQTVVPMVDHTETTVAATCTENGYKICSVCSTITQTLAATGHTEGTLPGVAPTCTETGLTEGVYCTVCNTVLTKQNVIDSKGHNYVNEVTTAPDCTTEGVRTYTCQTCGDSYTESIPATGHAAIYNPDTGALSCALCGVFDASLTPKYFISKDDLTTTGYIVYGDDASLIDTTNRVVDNQSYLTIKNLPNPAQSGHVAAQLRIPMDNSVPLEASEGKMFLVLKYRITGTNSLAKSGGSISLVFDMANSVYSEMDYVSGEWYYAIFNLSSYFTSGSYTLPHPIIGFIFDNTGLDGDSIDIECIAMCESEAQAVAWGKYVTNTKENQKGIIDSVADLNAAYGYNLWSGNVLVDEGTTVNGQPVVPSGQSKSYAQDTVISIDGLGNVTSVSLRGHANLVIDGVDYVVPVEKIGYTIDSLSQDDIKWVQTSPAEQPDLVINGVGHNAVRYDVVIYDLNVPVGSSIDLRLVYKLGNGLIVTVATFRINAVSTT